VRGFHSKSIQTDIVGNYDDIIIIIISSSVPAARDSRDLVNKDAVIQTISKNQLVIMSVLIFCVVLHHDSYI